MNPSHIRRQVAREALRLVAEVSDLPSAPPLDLDSATVELQVILDFIRDLVRAHIHDQFQEAPSCQPKP